MEWYSSYQSIMYMDYLGSGNGMFGAIESIGTRHVGPWSFFFVQMVCKWLIACVDCWVPDSSLEHCSFGRTHGGLCVSVFGGMGALPDVLLFFWWKYGYIRMSD
jgi:hypothetical protein